MKFDAHSEDSVKEKRKISGQGILSMSFKARCKLCQSLLDYKDYVFYQSPQKNQPNITANFLGSTTC
jgi:hypothetical protein